MIYVISERDTKFCKVGYTEGAVEDRINQLQTGNPHALVCDLFIDGDMGVESHIHSLLGCFSFRGEWFYPKDEVIKAIKIDARPKEIQPSEIANLMFHEMFHQQMLEHAVNGWCGMFRVASDAECWWREDLNKMTPQQLEAVSEYLKEVS